MDPRKKAPSVSVPGKVFLLGEYSVLAGGPALLASVGPRFSLRLLPEGGEASLADSLARFDPRSPVGKLLAWASSAGSVSGPFLGEAKKRGLPVPAFEFIDPRAGAGGFGGSTAEFALVFKLLLPVISAGLLGRSSAVFGAAGPGANSGDAAHALPEWLLAWRLYRELTECGAFSPSGADLVCQWVGGAPLFRIGAEGPSVVDLGPLLQESGAAASLVVFTAAGIPGRKVRTHEHLESLRGSTNGVGNKLSDKSSTFVDPLSPTLPPGLTSFLVHRLSRGVEEAVEALRFAAAGDARGVPVEEGLRAFGGAVTRAALALAEAGLESPEARADREALCRLPGVWGVKGCGALLSDSVLVVVEPGRNSERAQLIEAAQHRGLRLVADGLSLEPGIEERFLND